MAVEQSRSDLRSIKGNRFVRSRLELVSPPNSLLSLFVSWTDIPFERSANNFPTPPPPPRADGGWSKSQSVPRRMDARDVSSAGLLYARVVGGIYERCTRRQCIEQRVRTRPTWNVVRLPGVRTRPAARYTSRFLLPRNALAIIAVRT